LPIGKYYLNSGNFEIFKYSVK